PRRRPLPPSAPDRRIPGRLHRRPGREEHAPEHGGPGSMTKPRENTTTDVWKDRVDTGDWDRVTDEVNEYGGALLPQLLTDEETRRPRSMYPPDGLFRSTIDMGRHRFGEGQYRYFKTP